MKHQISLVGGQLLPVFIGIKEFKPDYIHFIVSKESSDKVSLLKPYLVDRPHSIHICNAFDFASLITIFEKLIHKLEDVDDIVFNLTSGTKIMVLAAQAIILERKLAGFYINQDDSYLELPSYKRKIINSNITTEEFFSLSGHKSFSAKTVDDFSKDDFIMAHNIEKFANNEKQKFTLITSYLRKKYVNQTFPSTGTEYINNIITLTWNPNKIQAKLNDKILFNYSSKNVLDLFVNAGWWELIVAEEVAKWSKAKEILIKCELSFRTDSSSKKNEIDILINLGKKLIFVECKSGSVKQEDINKMRIIKQTYGGLISKSILICRFMPSSTILEKCKELDIEVFCTYAFNNTTSPFTKLIQKLNDFEKKLTI